MSIEIEILNGDASWPLAEPLYSAIRPADAEKTRPWADRAIADADLRVLVRAESEDVFCHVGIHRREIKWNGRRMRAGGIGGVLTREDKRRRGYASIALSAAIQTLMDEGSMDFALLFCEPDAAPFFTGRGWRAFEGDIHAEQPEGTVRFEALAPYVFKLKGTPLRGVIDLCGPPW